MKVWKPFDPDVARVGTIVRLRNAPLLRTYIGMFEGCVVTARLRAGDGVRTMAYPVAAVEMEVEELEVVRYFDVCKHGVAHYACSPIFACEDTQASSLAIGRVRITIVNDSLRSAEVIGEPR